MLMVTDALRSPPHGATVVSMNREMSRLFFYCAVRRRVANRLRGASLAAQATAVPQLPLPGVTPFGVLPAPLLVRPPGPPLAHLPKIGVAVLTSLESLKLALEEECRYADLRYSSGDLYTHAQPPND